MRDDVELGNAGPVPEGLNFTQEQWDNECCCRCLGCNDCEHSCHYSDEQRVEHINRTQEAENE